MTRGRCTGGRVDDASFEQIAGSNLIRSPGDDLRGGQYSVLDQAPNAMVVDTQLRSSFRHGQPLAVLVRRQVGVDVVDLSQCRDSNGVPGLAMTRGNSQSVERCGDVLIGPLAGMLRMTVSASSGVRQPCSPERGLVTRIWDCWPPRQWMVRTTSRVASSTPATMSLMRVRSSCCRVRIVTPGASQAALRSWATAARSGGAWVVRAWSKACSRFSHWPTRCRAASQFFSS